MPAYLKKSKTEMLSDALDKLAKDTTITAFGPGSVARSLAEITTSQLGDFYDILDFNINQTLVATASGSALDMLGTLYQTERKQVSEYEAIDKKLGSFIFFLQSAHSTDIVIPKGTNVYVDSQSYLGQTFSYSTTEINIIPKGRTRVFASIQPNFTNTVYTAGKNKLIIHDFPSPAGTTVFCTNPKPITPNSSTETDEQFRARLIKSIRVASGGTLEAVRFAGLSVAGVRDVKIRQVPYGMGSFEAIIVPDRSTTSQPVTNAMAAMEDRRPLGVRMFTKTPELLSFDLTIDIIAPTATTNQVKDTLIRRVSVGISRYINSLLPGSELVYTQLLQIIMEASELIKDVVIKKYSIAGQEALRRNFRPAEDQQIVVGSVTLGLAQS